MCNFFFLALFYATAGTDNRGGWEGGMLSPSIVPDPREIASPDPTLRKGTRQQEVGRRDSTKELLFLDSLSKMMGKGVRGWR